MMKLGAADYLIKDLNLLDLIPDVMKNCVQFYCCQAAAEGSGECAAEERRKVCKSARCD